MIRTLAIRVLLFALPFAIYAGYFFLSQRANAQAQPQRTPWAWLFVAGLSLVAFSFVYVGLTEGDSANGVYIPPHVANGVVVPGHFEKAQKP